MLVDDFGGIIRKARTGLGMTLGEVARAAGMSPERLQGLETRGEPPREAEVLRLAPILELAPRPLWQLSQGAWHPRLLPVSSHGLIVHTMQVLQPDGRVTNCHLAGYEGDEEAIVVDPGGEPACILDELDRRGWRPRYVAITDAHPAHTAGLKPILDEWGVSVLIGADEIPLVGWQDGRFHPVSAGETLTLGRYWVRVLATPGHSPGGTSFLLDHACFVGDAWVAGSIGSVPDPPAFRRLREALEREVLSREPETRIFSGHGPSSTVGEEREHNPFFAR